MDKNKRGKPQFSGEWVKLGDVASYINGYAFKPTDYASEGKPIIRIQDLTGNAYQTNRFAGILDDKYRVGWGDVLISWSASLGVYVWSAEEAWLNQHIFKVQFNKLPVNKRFFIHQTRYVIAESASLAHGATMRHLTKKVFDNLPFFYPSEHDQDEIACHLDGIQLQIDSASEMLVRLDALVKSRFIEMFGDPTLSVSVTLLEDIADMKAGKTTTAKEIEAFQTMDNFPCYGGNGLRGYSKTPTHKGIYPLVGRQGALCGNVQIAKGVFRATEHAVVVDCKPLCNPEWLYHFLKYDDLGRLATGAAQPGLSVKSLRKVPVDVPSMEQQLKFVAFTAQVDKLRFDVQQQIDKLELLKNSLMQEYFG